MNCKWENFKLKNLLMFEDLTWNLSHSIAIVKKQNLYKKPSNIWKTFLHKFEIWFETCNIGKKFFLTHLKLKAFNNLKNFSCTHLKLEGWNSQQLEEFSSTHFFKFQHWNYQELEELSSTLHNLQHFEEVFSTPPTHLEKLQAPCMPPFGNEFPLTLQTKNLLSKGVSPFFM